MIPNHDIKAEDKLFSLFLSLSLPPSIFFIIIQKSI